MKTYGWDDRLPDLPLSPPYPKYECNQCGCPFDLPPIRMRDLDGVDDVCPECDSQDIRVV